MDQPIVQIVHAASRRVSSTLRGVDVLYTPVNGGAPYTVTLSAAINNTEVFSESGIGYTSQKHDFIIEKDQLLAAPVEGDTIMYGDWIWHVHTEGSGRHWDWHTPFLDAYRIHTVALQPAEAPPGSGGKVYGTPTGEGYGTPDGKGYGTP